MKTKKGRGILLKTKIKYFKAFFQSISVFLFSYSIIILLMFLVFKFEGLSINIFYDFFIVSVAVVIIFLIYQLIITFKKIQKFKSFNWGEITQVLPKDTEIEREYWAQVQAMRQEIHRLNNEKKRNATLLLSSVELWTHQMKVPLAAMKLMSDTDNFKDLKLEIDELSHYLDLMLNMMRLNQNSTDYQFTNVDLHELAYQSIQKYARFFIAKDLSIKLHEFKKEITTDRKWFQFAFEQVLYNAVKYTDEGQIIINLINDELVIIDSGIGISSQDLPRIFEAGYTGYNGHLTEKSSGLGLSQTKAVLENLGFSIRIESEKGTGTKVIINVYQDNF